MKGWTHLDRLLTGAALLITFALVGHRLYEHFRFEHAADQVFTNITAVADAVSTYHSNTGRWFPVSRGENSRMRVFLDPFHEAVPEYQGLNQEWLWRENNFGMVLQLVRFDPKLDQAIPIHLFLKSYQLNQPYLRVLTDYGPGNQAETEVLIRVQNKLPEGSVAEVDDHYYVIDLRRLMNAG